VLNSTAMVFRSHGTVAVAMLEEGLDVLEMAASRLMDVWLHYDCGCCTQNCPPYPVFQQYNVFTYNEHGIRLMGGQQWAQRYGNRFGSRAAPLSANSESSLFAFSRALSQGFVHAYDFIWTIENDAYFHPPQQLNSFFARVEQSKADFIATYWPFGERGIETFEKWPHASDGTWYAAARVKVPLYVAEHVKRYSRRLLSSLEDLYAIKVYTNGEALVASVCSQWAWCILQNLTEVASKDGYSYDGYQFDLRLGGNCWDWCGQRGGACPTYCGHPADFACCRPGYDMSSSCKTAEWPAHPLNIHSCVPLKTNSWSSRKAEPVTPCHHLSLMPRGRWYHKVDPETVRTAVACTERGGRHGHMWKALGSSTGRKSSADL